MKKYLIFVNVGGEMESPECAYMHYHICNGNTIEEAIKDWDGKVFNNKDLNNFKIFLGNDYKKYQDGRKMQIIELKEDEGLNIWKKLQWV